MPFLNLKISVFHNKRTLFNFSILFLLRFVCYLVSLIKKLFCQGTVSKEIGVTNSDVFKELVLTSLAPKRVFQKKSKLFLICFIFDVLFGDVGYIPENYRSQRLPLKE